HVHAVISALIVTASYLKRPQSQWYRHTMKRKRQRQKVTNKIYCFAFKHPSVSEGAKEGTNDLNLQEIRCRSSTAICFQSRKICSDSVAWGSPASFHLTTTLQSTAIRCATAAIGPHAPRVLFYLPRSAHRFQHGDGCD